MKKPIPHCLFSLLLLGALLLAPSSHAQDKPNIIFVLCDDLGWGDLGVLYQNERDAERKHLTPNIDQFAEEGIQLRSHYCPAPVCAPSRASLLTGFHQGHADVRNNQFDKALLDDYTLPGVMKTAGYTTALIGKYGLQGKGDSADSWPAYPTKRGFDEFLGYVTHVAGHSHYPAHTWALGNSEKHRGKMDLWHNDQEISAKLDKCFTSDLFTAYAKKWITARVQDRSAKPFFLYLAYDTPHAALQLPPCEYPEGGGLNGGLQWIGEDHKMINAAQGEVDGYIHPDHEGWDDLQQRQAGMIRRLDQSVGDLVQLLKDLKVDDNTLIVFSSDNGPHEESYILDVNYDADLFQAYGPFDGIKRDAYEGGIRVPTLVRWPSRIAGGRVNETPSQFHDWMNTFLDAAGVPLVAQSDGVSLMPTLTGEGEQVEPVTYVEYQNGTKVPKYDDFDESHRGAKRGEQQVIFMDGYKGLRTDIKSADQPFRIYDLSEDISELNDLASSSPEFEALQQRMQDRVIQIRRPNAEAARPYDEVALAPVAEQETTDGLTAQFTPGKFEWIPVAADSEQADISALDFEAPESGAVEIAGFIQVDKAGEYTVTLDSPDAALLHIHQSLVIDADTPQQDGGKQTSTVRLEKGLHPISLRYLTTGPATDLTFDGPGKIQFRR